LNYQQIAYLGQQAVVGLKAAGLTDSLAKVEEVVGSFEILLYAISRSSSPTEGGRVNLINNI
jgi:hypothetical protein